MGRRRCCCTPSDPGLCAVYTVRACPSVTPSFAGWNPGAGLTVRIRTASGGPTVAEGTTDADGRVTLCVPNSATRWVEVLGSPRLAYLGGSLVTNATNRTLSPGVAPGWCCQAGVWYNAARCDPATWGPRPGLFLTDALGTRGPLGGECGLEWSAVGAPQDRVWKCTYPGPVGLPFGDPTPTRSVAPGVVGVSYIVEPVSGGWRIRRRWSQATLLRHTEPLVSPASVYDTAYNEFASGPPACYAGDACYAEATIGPLDCSNFYWSGSLAQITGTLPDPVGGTVVLSG